MEILCQDVRRFQTLPDEERFNRVFNTALRILEEDYEARAQSQIQEAYGITAAEVSDLEMMISELDVALDWQADKPDDEVAHAWAAAMWQALEQQIVARRLERKVSPPDDATAERDRLTPQPTASEALAQLKALSRSGAASDVFEAEARAVEKSIASGIGTPLDGSGVAPAPLSLQRAPSGGGEPAAPSESLEAIAQRIARLAMGQNQARVQAKLGSPRGPVLTVVRDTTTGEIFVGLNTGIPEKLTEVMTSEIEAHEGRIARGEVIVVHTHDPKTHAEVNAFNRAIRARELRTKRKVPPEEFRTFELHNVWLKEGDRHLTTAPRCGHCAGITRGVSVTESMFIAEGGVAGEITVPQRGDVTPSGGTKKPRTTAAGEITVPQRGDVTPSGGTKKPRTTAAGEITVPQRGDVTPSGGTKKPRTTAAGEITVPQRGDVTPSGGTKKPRTTAAGEITVPRPGSPPSGPGVTSGGGPTAPATPAKAPAPGTVGSAEKSRPVVSTRDLAAELSRNHLEISRLEKAARYANYFLEAWNAYEILMSAAKAVQMSLATLAHGSPFWKEIQQIQRQAQDLERQGEELNKYYSSLNVLKSQMPSKGDPEWNSPADLYDIHVTYILMEQDLSKTLESVKGVISSLDEQSHNIRDKMFELTRAAMTMPVSTGWGEAGLFSDAADKMMSSLLGARDQYVSAQKWLEHHRRMARAAIKGLARRMEEVEREYAWKRWLGNFR